MMTRAAIVLLALLQLWGGRVDAGSPTCQAHSGLPDSTCTPGAIDSRVSQENIALTICRQGYTKTVRPPVSVTNKIKRERLVAYGYDVSMLRDYELDHLIPLELGGSSEISNLWPQLWRGVQGARAKDKVENWLRHGVCDGRISLKEAQREIAGDWVAVYDQIGR